VRVIAAATGVGKTEFFAKQTAERDSTIWITDRHEQVGAAVKLIEKYGGTAAHVVPLDGQTDGVANCLHPGTIKKWQAAGYDYMHNFCNQADCCERRADPNRCPFLRSKKELEFAENIVVTKALARADGFFSQYGNPRRQFVVIDEDPIALLRPVVERTKKTLEDFQDLLARIMRRMSEQFDLEGKKEAMNRWQQANWCIERIREQESAFLRLQAAGGGPLDEEGVDPVPVPVSDFPRRGRAADEEEKEERKRGRKSLDKYLRQQMQYDPDGTVANLHRDFTALPRAAHGLVYFTNKRMFFHAQVNIPESGVGGRRIFVLDATAKPEILRLLFAPRDVQVCFDQRKVRPAGRIIQLVDANYPRSSFDPKKLEPKVIRSINDIGDRHPEGRIVLISFKKIVKEKELAEASNHSDRIICAHFGDLRGRNDLEAKEENQIACHIVVGSPKTNELARQQLALAVYGPDILPFPRLVDVRRFFWAREPHEIAGGGHRRPVEAWCKGYDDPRMQGIYELTTTAELKQAADRARVLSHAHAVTYLLTNEPVDIWHVEGAYVGELFPQGDTRRSDYQDNYATYEAVALELLRRLNTGDVFSNAAVCRALGWGEEKGKRYYPEFRAKHVALLTMGRKPRKR
jgi:hypothetical protein